MSDSPADALFTRSFDQEEVQRVCVAAALREGEGYLAKLEPLRAAFDEPYRTALAQVLRLRADGRYVDENVLGGALERLRLVRADGRGSARQVSAAQVMGLLRPGDVAPGQAEAYLELMRRQAERKRQDEVQADLEAAVALHKGHPERLLEEVRRVAGSGAAGRDAAEAHPPEVLEILPYARELERRQRGRDFEGLDSGFTHLNYLCNGLCAELFVLAAPPGAGKTTWAWQVACQVAEKNRVPVVVVYLEQSKRELRDKALARLSGLGYRHIRRGRLRAEDPEVWGRLQDALREYGVEVGPYLTIVEGDQTTTVGAIRDIVASRLRTSKAESGLVVVDYLQQLPLSADDVGNVASPKDRVDLHVSTLRRLARDLGVSVLCISSENRAGYKSKKLDVFKESGGIEYSADVAAVLTKDETPVGSSDDPVRALDLNIVKNRNGECGVVKFRFYPSKATFVETGKDELPPDDES